VLTAMADAERKRAILTRIPMARFLEAAVFGLSGGRATP
jgi:hypothetical protein